MTEDVELNKTGGVLQLNARFMRQRTAPNDLRVVSLPPLTTLAQSKGYAYNNDFNSAPTIYIIETGVDISYRVSVNDYTVWLKCTKVTLLGGLPPRR